MTQHADESVYLKLSRLIDVKSYKNGSLWTLKKFNSNGNIKICYFSRSTLLFIVSQK